MVGRILKRGVDSPIQEQLASPHVLKLEKLFITLVYYLHLKKENELNLLKPHTRAGDNNERKI